MKEEFRVRTRTFAVGFAAALMIFGLLAITSGHNQAGAQVILGAENPIQEPFVYPALREETINRQYRFDLAFDPPSPQAGKESMVVVTILPIGGVPLTASVGNMTRFQVVSDNLEEFHSIDAAAYEDVRIRTMKGLRFVFPVTFGMGGRYTVAVNFIDRGASVSKLLFANVQGPDQKSTRWNFSRSREVDGIRADLRFNSTAARFLNPTEFVVELMTGDEPVMDLELHQGAFARVTVYRDNARLADHLQGITWKAFKAPARLELLPGGPRIYFYYAFPGTDRKYRIFVQFYRGDTETLVPFDVRIPWVRTNDSLGRWR
jgi:hypothetical protein